jgi:hypothetical protein
MGQRQVNASKFEHVLWSTMVPHLLWSGRKKI